MWTVINYLDEFSSKINFINVYKAWKTYAELFFMLCDDIQDMDLTNALQGLMSLFTDMVAMVSADITEMLKSKVENWMKFHGI